jgi:hypothetical protein
VKTNEQQKFDLVSSSHRPLVFITMSSALPVSSSRKKLRPETEADPESEMDPLFCNKTHFGNESGTLPNGEFVPGEDSRKRVAGAKILVLGAGGLGCEVRPRVKTQ